MNSSTVDATAVITNNTTTTISSSVQCTVYTSIFNTINVENAFKPPQQTAIFSNTCDTSKCICEKSLPFYRQRTCLLFYCFSLWLCAHVCVFVFVDTEMLYFTVFLLKYILKIKQLKFSVIVFNLQYRRVFAIYCEFWRRCIHIFCKMEFNIQKTSELKILIIVPLVVSCASII